MATDTKQRQAAKAFVKDWLGKGYEKGETSKAEQVALAMREAGEPAEKIALYTGLSLEQIQGFTTAAVKK